MQFHVLDIDTLTSFTTRQPVCLLTFAFHDAMHQILGSCHPLGLSCSCVKNYHKEPPGYMFFQFYVNVEVTINITYRVFK